MLSNLLFRAKRPKAADNVGFEQTVDLSSSPSVEANQEGNTEEAYKIRPLAVDAKTKKKKRRPNLLKEIANFDKSSLKQPMSLEKDDFGSEDSEVDEAPKVKKKTTVSQKSLCFAFWNGSDFPVHKLKYIVLQIPAKDEVTLDFSCLSQLTDLSFAILADMKDKESARFNAVERILLDGCFQITDTGLGWLAKAFPKLKWLSLVGCSKVTDLGLVTLAEECSDLISVDLSSTGVHFLPEKWHTAEGMRMNGCSILFPLVPADAAIAKSKSKASSDALKGKKDNLLKVCILAQSTGTKSLLAAVMKQKQTSKPVLPKIECGVTVDGGMMATFIEADESFSSSLLTNRSVLVLTTELKDKTKIREEADYMRGLIVEAISRQPKTQILIVGLSDDSAGIVPSDFIKEEILSALEKIRTTAMDTNYSLSSVKDVSMTVKEQLQFSAAQILQGSLKDIKIKSMEVNVDKEKDIANFVEEIGKAAEDMAILDKITYSKQIYEWARDFHTKCPASLSTGVHTLHEAAQLLLKHTQFTERLRPFGAVQFLASIGKLSMWQNKGQTYVANAMWLCKVLAVLLSPSPDHTTNQGSFSVLDNSAPVWNIEALKKELGTHKLDWAQNIFTFTKRENTKGRLNVGFLYALSHNYTSSVLERILTSVIQLCTPVHVWRRGVILHDSILAVMVSQTGKVLNVNAYLMDDRNPDSPTSDQVKNQNIVDFVWNNFMKYRLAVTHELTRAGLVFEELPQLSDSLQPVPELTGCLSCHTLKPGRNEACEICGIVPVRAAYLTEMSRRVEPKFLNPENILNSMDIQGFVDGGQIRLTGPSEFKVRACLDPFGCHVCSILLIQGNVKLLIITFSSSSGDRLTLNLSTRTIEIKAAGKEEKVTLPGDIGSPTLQGERGTFRIESLEPFTIGLYLGPRLVHSAQLPFNRYVLEISSKNFTEAVNEAALTVLDSDFFMSVPKFKTGMRLEALDKLNPSLICVATITDINQEAGKVLIHFDGWTKKYDYWTDFSDPDLHPLGYMYERGQQLSRTSRKNPNLQPPHGYGKTFDWLTYLKETTSEPVPFESFTKAQIDGASNTETIRVQQGLGVTSVMPDGSGPRPCYSNSMTSEHINQKVGQMIHNVAEVIHTKGLDELLLHNGYPLFCFLPSHLTPQSLQFPCLQEILSAANQKLHCICPGQVSDFHFVNHGGLLLDPKQVDKLSSWPILTVIYAALIYQKHVQIELALRSIFRYYISHIILMADSNIKMDMITSKEINMTPEQTETVNQLVDDALKSGESTFKQQFGARQSSSTLMCLAHRLADSPSANIQEITVDSFQNLAGNIYVLHLENNPLSSLPADFFVHFTNLTQMVLDGCNITELPDFKSNTVLEEIHVKSNKLTSLPDDMKQLSSLKILNISHNPLDVLPSVVSSLTSLTELYADNIGTVDLAPLCALTSLVKLSVSQNLIPAIPDKLNNLPLTSLDIAGLPRFPCGTTFSMQSVKTFLNKYTVYRRIPEKDLQKMVEAVENLGEQTTNSAKIFAFGAALYEKYPRIGKMGTEDVPPVLYKMTKLVRLDLSSHAFKTLGDDVKSLTSLEHLNLSSNPSLQSVSPELANLPLKGERHLVRALTNKNHSFYHDYGENITDGIDITEWKLDTNYLNKMGIKTESEDSDQPLHFSVWDFAGQTVYYNTHQFFLSNRAVYLLLWNIRLGFEHAGLDFWLSSVACHAPKAPILVVGTHCDKLVQAVQFLHDLGSLQFFNTAFLRSHVVIVPQWIVDVMACIVTVHEGPIKEGKLLYSNMKNVWKDYPEELHPWLLRLTEEFDLTFPLLSEDANIVPCLLPTTEPKYDFAQVSQEKHERESKMVYRFEYLPAGLFNRAQVRLHQFSDSSVMWKKGFMLKKNNHRALLLQLSNTEVVVIARGYKPENTLFLVHEVFECLISDAYSGVSYDFSIPCAECVSELTLDPCMFPASKIKRAFDMKAPFLQCDKNFHIISIPEIQASLPPDSGSDFDDHLGRSVRELQDLGEAGAGGPKCLLIYTKRNVPGLEREGKEVDPTRVLEDLRAAGINT
ncbi:lethal(3)malignant brain tumor-like protein 1, partial [Elysia marginata]